MILCVALWNASAEGTCIKKESVRNLVTCFGVDENANKNHTRISKAFFRPSGSQHPNVA